METSSWHFCTCPSPHRTNRLLHVLAPCNNTYITVHHNNRVLKKINLNCLYTRAHIMWLWYSEPFDTYGNLTHLVHLPVIIWPIWHKYQPIWYKYLQQLFFLHPELISAQNIGRSIFNTIKLRARQYSLKKNPSYKNARIKTYEDQPYNSACSFKVRCTLLASFPKIKLEEQRSILLVVALQHGNFCWLKQLHFPPQRSFSSPQHHLFQH